MRKKPGEGGTPARERGRRWLALGLLCALAAGALGLGQAPKAARGEEALAPALGPDGVYALSDITQEELDTETLLDPGEVPEFVPWLLEVAAGELGYKEGARSYTKYGEWSGDPYAEWCAEFLCWCVNQVDETRQTQLLNGAYPNYSGQNTGRDWFIARGRFVYRKGNCPDWGYQWLWGQDKILRKNDYIPRPGDWMFFSYNEAGDTEHVAMVEYCALDAAGEVVIHVIEGNNPSSVQRNAYRLDSSQVLGFGITQDLVGTTMRGGNRGDKVRWLQELLWEMGFLEQQHITGTFGGNTKAAVAAFQKTLEGKSATGVADMQTQNALAEALAKKVDEQPETWLVVE